MLAIILTVWVFGWTGGKLLVEQSYTDAKVKVSEQKEQRAAKKQAKREAEKVTARPARPPPPLQVERLRPGQGGELDAHAGPAMRRRAAFLEPEFQKIPPSRAVAAWLVAALSLLAAAAIIPGASIEGFWERSWSPWS